MRFGPWLKAAHASRDRVSVHRPVNQTIFVFQDRRKRGFLVLLSLGLNRRKVTERFADQVRPDLGKSRKKSWGNFGWLNLGCFLEKNWASIQLLNDFHRGDTGLSFTIHYGPVHRRRPPVFWQQRKVNIDAPILARVKKFRRQDFAVSHNNGHVRLVRSKQLFGFCAFYLRWLMAG